MHKRGYFNRSEAMRDLIRDLLDTVRSEEHDEGHCIATLSYIYTPSELASRITATQHEHHDLIVSTMDVHMDHDNCLEVAVLSGTIRNVKDFANHIIAMQVAYGMASCIFCRSRSHRSGILLILYRMFIAPLLHDE